MGLVVRLGMFVLIMKSVVHKGKLIVKDTVVTVAALVMEQVKHQHAVIQDVVVECAVLAQSMLAHVLRQTLIAVLMKLLIVQKGLVAKLAMMNMIQAIIAK